MGFLEGATTAVNAVQSAITTGPANALSQVTSGLSSLAGLFGAPKLPVPNILSNYATYNYVLGMGVLTETQLNNPDETYMAGIGVDLICKSAGSDPGNRVATAYGKFDFFMENLEVTSTIGFEKNNNTNITAIKFDIVEPYSMGMWIISCQTAAYKAGWNNYKEAPFLLTIQFRGNTQEGQPQLVPNSSRFMPFRLSMINMKVSEKGAVYTVTAIPYNYTALASRTAKFKNDVSARGATVQEVLQTGEKSLQRVINDRLKQYKTDGTVKVADEVLILFPNEIASSAAPAANNGNKESKDSATTSDSGGGGGGSPFTKLGVSKSKVNDTLVQPDGECNALGKASMGFGLDKKGDPIIGQESQVWDAKNKVWVRGNNKSDIKQGEFRFSQDTDIINAINQVLLASNFPKETLDESKVTKEGMRDWWTIDTQVYTIPSEENLKTGSKAKLIVYRVYPYQVSVSRTMPPNTAPPGVTSLKKQAVKEYNYLYTGKNTEVLKFDIEFSASFAGTLAADNLKRSQDVANSDSMGEKKPAKDVNVVAESEGNKPVAKAGVTPTNVTYSGTTTSTDRLGGGGAETQETRAARLFHDAITRGKDMVMLNMEIWGDPYYIAQSGMGNYSSQTIPGLQNLNKDGTVSWQNGEVYITVNFRTPTDINQGTGLYNFAGNTSAPVIQFSGLYQVRRIRSTFSAGQFKQVLMGSRLDQQENPTPGTNAQTYATSKTKVEEAPPAATE